MSKRAPFIANHRHAVALAVVLTVASILAWNDAYEGRGKTRPRILSFVPGVV